MQRLIRDGIAIAFEEAGSGEPALLLVHCWCCDHSFLRPQLEYFKGRHRIVSVDLRGHGESDKPEQDYTLKGFADDLVWLCSQLDVQKPVVIGHSMGGNTSLALAASYPDFAAAIVMIDSAIIKPPTLAQALTEASGALKGPAYRDVMRGLFASITDPADDPVRNERLLEVMTSAPQYVMTSAFDQHLVLWDAEAAAKACQVPALYIGAANFITDIARFKELCPQLVVGQTVGAGHFNNQEVPEQVNAMIERFLSVTSGQHT